MNTEEISSKQRLLRFKLSLNRHAYIVALDGEEKQPIVVFFADVSVVTEENLLLLFITNLMHKDYQFYKYFCDSISCQVI